MDTTDYRRCAPGIKIDAVDPASLSSIRAYNRLKISPSLYDFYQDYEYLLTYELDAFVFRDELLDWCAEGWDYIGAPWFEGYENATPASRFKAVGNSGFSLRKVDAVRAVLRSFRMIRPFAEVYSQWRATSEVSLNGLRSLLRRSVTDNLFHARFNGFAGNEDLFWAVHARNRFPWFSVASYERARAFSFEMLPERLFGEREGRLPFGCHKWHGNTLDFWETHIAAAGYDLSSR